LNKTTLQCDQVLEYLMCMQQGMSWKDIKAWLMGAPISKPKTPSYSSLEPTTLTFNPSPYLDSTHLEVMVRNQWQNQKCYKVHEHGNNGIPLFNNFQNPILMPS
jgi:hypothetical protein